MLLWVGVITNMTRWVGVIRNVTGTLRLLEELKYETDTEGQPKFRDTKRMNYCRNYCNTGHGTRTIITNRGRDLGCGDRKSVV